jgi:FkbM family methyltransferase
MRHLKSRIAYHRDQLQRLGWKGWLTWQARSRSKLAEKALGYRAWTRLLSAPIAYRAGESDLDVFRQIFIEREYSCLDGEEIDGLIIDCGANVGYSSAYLLERFPRAHLLAVEPDQGNFEMLLKNVARFGDRATCVHGGVWSNRCGLVFDENPYRDGRAWAIRVREARQGETAAIEAFSIPDLMAMTQNDRVSLLKMDVERAEIQIFGSRQTEWVAACERIVIELHDEECERVFHEAIAGQGFLQSRSGELTVCLRSSNDIKANQTAGADA